MIFVKFILKSPMMFVLTAATSLRAELAYIVKWTDLFPLLPMTPPPPTTAEQAQCPNCGGEGREIIGENYVTLDMAIDAGDRDMAGMFHSYEYGECNVCNGTGFLPSSSHEAL